MSEFQAEDAASWLQEDAMTRPGRPPGDEAARAAELAALRQRIKHAEQIAHKSKESKGGVEAGHAERLLAEERKLEQEEREALQRARAEVGACISALQSHSKQYHALSAVLQESAEGTQAVGCCP